MNRRQWLAASVGLGLIRPALAKPLAGPIALNANENAYGPGPAALRAMAEAAARAARYPMNELRALTSAIASTERVSEDQVVIGSGSGEILCAAALAWRGGKNGAVVAANPTFEQLPGYARRLGVRVDSVRLDASLRHDLPAMAAAVGEGTSLIYVCNPNNPTGTLLDPDQLRDFVRSVHRRAVVFVDEAYVEFQADPESHSLMPLVREGLNVVVARTFSKLHGLAGLRIGYGVAPPKLAADLRRAKMTLPSGIGLAAALASYHDKDYLRVSRARLVDTRQWFVEECTKRGLRCADSAANFAFVRVGIASEKFRDAMAVRGIKVGRPFPGYPEWSRITIGKEQDMEQAIAALGGILATG